MYVLRPLVLILGLLLLALWAQSLLEVDPEHVRPPHVAPPVAEVFVGQVPDVLGAQADALTIFVEERLRAEREWAEGERLAAEEAARVEAARRRAAPPVLRPGTGAPHSDAWWWGVAICEQGGRNDPYFGYFSWMDGSAAGMTWEEQVAKSNDLLIRAGREVGPWAASCVAAGYAASPGG